MTEKPANFTTPTIPGVQVAEDLARLWTNHYLIEHMGERSISVAVTPNGYNTKTTFPRLML